MRRFTRYVTLALLGSLAVGSVRTVAQDASPDNSSRPATPAQSTTPREPSTFGGSRSPMSLSVQQATPGSGSSRSTGGAYRHRDGTKGHCLIPCCITIQMGSGSQRAAVAGSRNAGWPAQPAAGGVAARRAAGDPAVRRTQIAGAAMTQPLGPGVMPLAPPSSDLSAIATTSPLGGQSLSLQAAMYGALTGNPDLVTLRQGNPLAPPPRPSRSRGTFPPRSTRPSGSTSGRSP